MSTADIPVIAPWRLVRQVESRHSDTATATTTTAAAAAAADGIGLAVVDPADAVPDIGTAIAARAGRPRLVIAARIIAAGPAGTGRAAIGGATAGPTTAGPGVIVGIAMGAGRLRLIGAAAGPGGTAPGVGIDPADAVRTRRRRRIVAMRRPVFSVPAGTAAPSRPIIARGRRRIIAAPCPMRIIPGIAIGPAGSDGAGRFRRVGAVIDPALGVLVTVGGADGISVTVLLERGVLLLPLGDRFRLGRPGRIVDAAVELRAFAVGDAGRLARRRRNRHILTR